MIHLYYAPTPNGQKISIALEELALSYEVKPIDISAGDQFQPDFLRISPNNRIPAIIDFGGNFDGQDNQKISIFESGAILLYLAEKTGQLMPKDAHARFAVYEWLMWQMGGFGPMLGQAHHFNYYAPDRIDYAMTRYSNEANRLYGVLDRRLAQTPYVAGEDYSIADISILPWTRTYARQNVDIEDYPYVKAWRAKLGARPGVIAGMKVGAGWTSDLKTLSGEDFATLFGTN